MDFWVDIEHRGKDAGKLHLKSHWVANQVGPSKDEHQGLLEQAQAELIALSKKKAAIKHELEAVEIRTKEHEASWEGRRHGGNYDDSAYQAAIAQAHEHYRLDIERITHQRDLALQWKTDFELAIANQV